MLLKDMNIDQLEAMLKHQAVSRKQARYASTKLSAARWAKAGQKGIALAMSNAAKEQLANMDPKERVWTNDARKADKPLDGASDTSQQNAGSHPALEGQGQ